MSSFSTRTRRDADKLCKIQSIDAESRKVKLPNNNPDQDEYLPIKYTKDNNTYIL